MAPIKGERPILSICKLDLPEISEQPRQSAAAACQPGSMRLRVIFPKRKDQAALRSTATFLHIFQYESVHSQDMTVLSM